MKRKNISDINLDRIDQLTKDDSYQLKGGTVSSTMQPKIPDPSIVKVTIAINF